MNTPLTARALEALLLDRHLGELSPEAEELLDLYLSTHPEAGLEASKLANDVSSLRKQLAPPTVLPSELPARRQDRTAAPLWFPRLFPLAASLTLGLFGGWLLMQRSTPSNLILATSTPATSRLSETPYRATNSFWSAERFVAKHRISSPRRSSIPTHMWESHTLQSP